VSAAATTLHAVSQAQKLVFSLASSSYPHISGWLGQKTRASKQQSSAAGVSSATTSLTELLAEEEMLLSSSPELSLLNDLEGDEGRIVQTQSGNDN
jgi:hypothetical protein